MTVSELIQLLQQYELALPEDWQDIAVLFERGPTFPPVGGPTEQEDAC
jgi:hypothetical protein